MPTAAAIVASSLIGAGAQSIQASKSRKASARIAKRQEELQRKEREAVVREGEQAREAEQVSALTEKSQAQSMRNQALKTRGIKSFGGLSTDVLSDGGKNA
jgi:hypothetical protein